MKRKTIGAAAAYLSGSFFASFFTTPGVVGGFVLSASVVVVMAGRRRGWKRCDFLIVALSFMSAVIVFNMYTALKYRPAADLIGKNGSFVGEVAEYDIYDGGKARYTLKCRINDEVNTKVILFIDELDADYGDTIAVENCRFTGFNDDYLIKQDKYNRSRGIFLSAEDAEGITVTHRNKGKLLSLIGGYRRKIISRFRRVMGSDSGGFMAGMLFGEKRYLDDNIRTSLYRCGIGHVLAVSGLHITVAAHFMMLLLRYMKAGRKLSFVLINIIFALFIAISRFPVSAFRAVLMLDIAYSAPIFKRESDNFNSLAAAVLIMCISSPYIIYSSGFLLSISGTFGIAVLGPHMARSIKTDTKLGQLKKSLIIGACTTIMILPASVGVFSETSIIAPAANLLIVPICSAAMILGLIYTVTGGIFNFLLYPAMLMIDAVIRVSEKIAVCGIMRLTDPYHIISGILVIALISAFILHLYFDSRRLTAAFISVSFAVCILTSVVLRNMSRRYFTAAFLGKNSISAAVLTYGSCTCVIDLDGLSSDARYVEKYLTENGIDSVDMLVLTKKIPSAYSAYNYEFSLFSVGSAYIFGDMSAMDGDIPVYAVSALDMDIDNMKIRMTENEIHISDNDASMKMDVLPPIKGGGGDKRIIIEYGGKPYNISCENTYDFEIIMTDGKYYLRSDL